MLDMRTHVGAEFLITRRAYRDIAAGGRVRWETIRVHPHHECFMDHWTTDDGGGLWRNRQQILDPGEFRFSPAAQLDAMEDHYRVGSHREEVMISLPL